MPTLTTANQGSKNAVNLFYCSIAAVNPVYSDFTLVCCSKLILLQ